MIICENFWSSVLKWKKFFWKAGTMNKYGLSPETLRAIKNVMARYPGIKKGILYGSRAKGNFKPGSDIDLVLKGETLKLTDLFRIENEMDDLLLPYHIDLSLYHQIDNAELSDHINRVGVELYTKEK